MPICPTERKVPKVSAEEVCCYVGRGSEQMVREAAKVTQCLGHTCHREVGEEVKSKVLWIHSDEHTKTCLNTDYTFNNTVLYFFKLIFIGV